MYVNKQMNESSTKVHTDIEMIESGEFYNQCKCQGIRAVVIRLLTCLDNIGQYFEIYSASSA